MTIHLRHFKRHEFDCKCCGRNEMKDSMLAVLDELRERSGSAIVITSGYRCPDYNARESSTGRNGPHTTGLAADLFCSHEWALTLFEHALKFPELRGFGLNQKGAGRFIHLDMLARERRTFWTY